MGDRSSWGPGRRLGGAHDRPRTAVRYRRDHLAAYDQNDYWTLRDDRDNLRPRQRARSGPAGPATGGNAYMHIQRKIAALLHLLEDDAALESSTETDEYRERLVGTAELRARALGGPQLPGGGTVAAPRRRWYDDVLDEAADKIGTIKLADDSYWSLRAAELRGRQSHRDTFDESLKAIYGRMLTDAHGAK